MKHIRYSRYLPNCLSVFRMLLSLSLPAFHRPALFVAGYLLCGLSDILDGFTARRWGLESTLGARLDSLADGVFWVIVFVRILPGTGLVTGGVLAVFSIILVLRVLNLFITRIKFRQWGMLHSWGNKTTGLLLYFLLPICIVTGTAAPPTLGILFLAGLLSALDETAILCFSRDYQVNRKSYFHKGGTGK